MSVWLSKRKLIQFDRPKLARKSMKISALTIFLHSMIGFMVFVYSSENFEVVMNFENSLVYGARNTKQYVYKFSVLLPLHSKLYYTLV